jgi:hypothetical protein
MTPTGDRKTVSTAVVQAMLASVFSLRSRN